LAGLLNAIKVVKKDLSRIKIVFVGFGAANTKTFEYIVAAGANPEKCLCLDSGGVIHKQRADIDWEAYTNKKRVAKITKPSIIGDSTKALKGADVVIAFSRPNSFSLGDLAKMANKAIVFACANPIPEVNPLEAVKLENVTIVGTGRSDFPTKLIILVFPRRNGRRFGGWKQGYFRWNGNRWGQIIGRPDPKPFVGNDFALNDTKKYGKN